MQIQINVTKDDGTQLQAQPKTVDEAVAWLQELGTAPKVEQTNAPATPAAEKTQSDDQQQ